jgi:NAD(P)-dependent dehydrogenase (short-subunit alcohol dehydrogenase family)
LFAREGATVFIAGRKRDRGEALATEITGAGGKASFVELDIVNQEDAAVTTRRCATLSSFQKSVSAFCWIGAAQNCGAHWRTISRESEQSANGLFGWHYLPGISGVGD